MHDDHLKHVHDLIRLKELPEARSLLKQIDHPDAPILLAEIERYLALRPELDEPYVPDEHYAPPPDRMPDPPANSQAVSNFDTENIEESDGENTDVNTGTDSAI